MKRILAFLLAVALVVACEKDDPPVVQDGTEETTDDDSSENESSGDSNSSSDSSDEGDDESEDGSEPDDSQGTGDDSSDIVVDDDYTDDVLAISDFTKTVNVVWSGSAATVAGADDVIDYSASGGHVTIGTSSSAVEGMNIVLSGSCADGSLKVYNSCKYVITLAGVTLASKTGAAINNQCKKRTFIFLQENKTNTLSDASSYSDVPSGEDCKGCLFSEGQLVITGTGRMDIAGNYKHAIASDDYVRQFNGTVNVTSALTDGIHTNDHFRMDGGTLSVNSTSDGIECDEGYINIVGGDITVRSVGDAIQTSYDGTSTDIETYVSVSGGTLDIKTTGTKGSGIGSAGDILISGGDIAINVSGSASKALNSDNNVTISNGTLSLTTSGAAIYDSEDKDTSSPSCIKAENIVTISGGGITAKSSGSGGKCVNCYQFAMRDGILSAATSGSGCTYGSSSSKSKAIKASNSIAVSGGDITVSTSGSTAEGIESKGSMVVSGGSISVYSAKDDGINTAGTYTQTGGYVYVYAAGNDGLDSNYGRSGAIVITGGVLISHGTSSPEEGIDADSNSFISIKGGTVFSSGGQQGGGTVATPNCSQPCLFLQNQSLTTGYFTVTDSGGKVIMSCKVPRSMSQCYSFVCSPSFSSGSAYSYGVVSSAPSSPTDSWSSYYYSGGTVSGSLSGTYTASSGCTTIGSGSSSGGGGFPGGGGGGRP